MSDAGMDMLSDMPLSVSPTSSTMATGRTAMQLDTTDFNRMTNNTLALPQALLNRTNWTTRRTRTLIQALIGMYHHWRLPTPNHHHLVRTQPAQEEEERCQCSHQGE